MYIYIHVNWFTIKYIYNNETLFKLALNEL